MNQIKKLGENILGTVLAVAGVEGEYQNQKCIIQGWLTKLAVKSARNWTVRYFLLYENALVYFADSESQYPRGVMRFDEDFYVCDSCLVPYGFQVSNLSKTYYLQADSLSEKMFWMHTIAKVIGNLSMISSGECHQSEQLVQELEEYAANRPISSRAHPPPTFLHPTSPLPPRPAPRHCSPEVIHKDEESDDKIPATSILSAPLPPRPRPRIPPSDPNDETDPPNNFPLDDQEETFDERNRSISSESCQSESSNASDPYLHPMLPLHPEAFRESPEHPPLHFSSGGNSPTLGDIDIEVADKLLSEPPDSGSPIVTNVNPDPEIECSVRSKAAMWQEKLKEHQMKQAANPFSDSQQHSSHLKLTKMSDGYGRPPPGSMTARRGDQATEWVNHEIEKLVAVIKEIGTTREDGTVSVLFGRLFIAYQEISNTLVGIMRRAKKKKYIAYSGAVDLVFGSLKSSPHSSLFCIGDMLFQGYHDDVEIIVLPRDGR